MTTILCFGDSNTYGYIPGGSGRYPREGRYPGILADFLGADYRIEEDGVVGRTTVFEDAIRPGRNGLDAIRQSVQAAKPDLVLLMLGTNDCKAQFAALPETIADGMLRLAEVCRQENPAVKIILAAPAPLDPIVLSSAYADYDEMSFITSLRLAGAYQHTAERHGFGFVDVGEAASASPVDGEHLTAMGHFALAQHMKEVIVTL